MTCESPGAGALDYFPCRYGQSRLVFRGPWRDAKAGYCVALGGGATYGRFVARPWPELLEQASGRMVLNLGVPQAGPDAFLNEPAVLQMAARARMRFLTVPGAVNISNRFYTVHPRRNDRFLKAHPALRRLYPEVDFTDFAFTRHMIRTLASHGPQRFAELAQGLSQAWLDRMGLLLGALGGPTVLVWFAERPPPMPGERLHLVQGTPLLVDSMMLTALRPHLAGLVEVVPPVFAGTTDGKDFTMFEEAAALALPGPQAHQAMADALAPWIRQMAA
jgi:hypothetical protein